MKTFARVVDGVVTEIIQPMQWRMPPAGMESQYPPEAWGAWQAREGAEVPLSERFPADFCAECVEVPEGITVAPGYLFDGGQFLEPLAPQVPPMTAEQAGTLRDGLLAVATLRIAPLQDAVDLDDASPADKALLRAWKQYRVALSRIEQTPGFPAEVEWPTAPN